MRAIQEELMQKVLKQEEDALISRLKEMDLLGLFAGEDARRFKKFIVERQGSKKTIYYNDGTLNGKRVITFETHIDYEGMDVKIRTSFY